jgi:transcriptional regulator with XRE-family HTH domain
VPARHDPNAKAETMLARVRMARGITQEELADAIGISLPTYRRLERKDMDNPGIRYLANAALALGDAAGLFPSARRANICSYLMGCTASL